jgi:acetylornithine deacetylase/succinyl-diaminopimelate desuccinylase-like protein
MRLDADRTRTLIDTLWNEQAQPSLEEFVRIPNQSPSFDPEWASNGLLERAVAHFEQWIRGLGIENLQLEVLRPEGRTPLLLAEVPGTGAGTVLCYGHLDKQPPVDGWDEDKGAYQPVVQNDRLYGRGTVDDGYAPYGEAVAIKALQELGAPLPRCVMFIETGEESGSPDVPYYFEQLRERLGNVSMIVCPDSGCGDYERLWFTSSLRGLVTGTLTVSLQREGLHSGSYGGIIASSFRVLRLLLDRVESPETGALLVPEFNVTVPEARQRQARETADILGRAYLGRFPLQPGARTVTDDVAELLLASTWRPTLEVTGAAGLPPLENAGNVLRPFTSVKLSVRIPPGVDPEAATSALKRTLEADPPFGARVSFEPDHSAVGWAAPEFPDWLDEAARDASQAFFGHDPAYYGEGGSIPLIARLGEMFPDAYPVVTGLLGEGANAHGPNESLHLPATRSLVACLAALMSELAARG